MNLFNSVSFNSCNSFYGKVIKSLTFFFLFAIATASIAQSDQELYQEVGLRIHAGALLDIHAFSPDTKINTSYELSFNQRTSGKQYWNQFYNYPVVGLNFNYTDFGNRKILGQGLALSTVLKTDRSINDRFGWFYQFELGLARLTKPYDTYENPDNYVFGSDFAARVAGSSGFTFELSEHFNTSFALEFVHFSNGHMRVPNIGGNTLNGVLELTYRKTNSGQEQLHEIEALDKFWRPGLSLGLGMHEIEGTVIPSGGPAYPVYFGSIGMSKRLAYANLLSFGININYYRAFQNFIINQQIFNDDERRKSYKAFIFIGHEFLFGHLALQAQFGVNIYYPFRKTVIETGFFEKNFLHDWNSNVLGLKYYFRETKKSLKLNPFLGIGLRSIGGKADFTQVSMGIVF